MKKSLLYLVALGNFFAPALRAQESSEVKIPLEKYLELIEKQKNPPLTVIEEVTLNGDYRTSSFQIAIKGRAVSPWKKETVLSNFEGSIRNCKGSAILSFESGNYHVTPQAGQYAVTCTLSPKNKSLQLTVLNALYFESRVANSESNISGDDTERRQVALFEKARETETRARADVMARANYKLTILPDNSKFEYRFVITNPNRTAERYEMKWLNNEIIEAIATDLKYQEAGSAVGFTVPSGEHSVVVRGKLNGEKFQPLLKSEEQYLLIQNHPLMQVQPTTNWRRIATSESSIPQEFNSARAFLIDPRESFAWSAKKLQVFSALGYTIKNAQYLYYVPRDGQVIVEATYQINNQGTPEIALPVPGKALYMAVDHQSTPLYKDEKGQLLVSLTSGLHSIVVQYQPNVGERHLATGIRDHLLKPAAVVSQSQLNLRYDTAWRMIAGRFGDDFVSRIHLISFLWAFLMGALLYWLLKKLYNVQDKKLLTSVSALFALLTLFSGFYSLLLTMLAVGLVVWRYRLRLLAFFKSLKKIDMKNLGFKKLLVGSAAFAVTLFLVMQILTIFVGGLQRNVYAKTDSVGQMSADYPESAPAPAMEMEADGARNRGGYDGLADNVGALSKLASPKGGGRAEGRAAMAQGGGDAYEGLPARIEIPAQGHNEYFNLSLIAAEKDLTLSSLFVRNYFFTLLNWLALLALAAILYNKRDYFRDHLLKRYPA